jgi:hypothetical protein
MIKNKWRSCPQCEDTNAAAHPLAIGAVVTVLRFWNGCLMAEGIGNILRTAGESDVYFIRFRGEAGIQKRLIFPDYQHDTARAIEIVSRHLAKECAFPPSPPQPRTCGEKP